MAKRITKLTAEQDAYLSIYREDVRTKALRGQWATDDEMREAVRALYAARGQKEPVVLVFSNPLLCLLARGLLRQTAQKKDHLRDHLKGQLWGQLWGQLEGQLWGHLWGQLGGQIRGQLMDQLGDQLGGQIRGQLGGQIRGQLRGQLMDQLGDQLGGQIRGQLGGQIRGQLRGQLEGQLEGQLGGQLEGQLEGQLWGQLEGQLWGQLGGQIRGQLRGQLMDQLGGQLEGQLGDQLRDQLRDQLWGQLRDQLWGQLRDQLWGQLGGHLRGQLWGRDLWQPLWFAGGSEAYWIAYYAYGHHIGARYDNTVLAGLRAWERYAEVCGPLYPYDGIAFVSRRPETHFDAERRLHCETGPAMHFDGYAVYVWHGTRIPAEWIEDRTSLTPDVALTWRNVEQRRAACAIVGWDRILATLGGRTIDADGDPEIGTLIEVMLPDEEGERTLRARFLEARCGTGRTIREFVPPDIPTAIAAQAWRVGMDTADWTKPTIRT